MLTRCISTGAKRRRRRSVAAPQAPSQSCRLPQARWDQRWTLPADSPPLRGKRPPSERCRTSAGSSRAKPVQRSPRERAPLSTLIDLPIATPAAVPVTAVTPKSLGLAACTAIVVGNMVGSGFYLSPSAVAPYGVLAILSWIVMGGGAICLGLTFARLARLDPAQGGPYAYSRVAFGDFAGFLIAWGYWISIW